MENGNRKELLHHVLMFPWLAHGHISPFLELSMRLAGRGITVSFCSTPSNINSIKRTLQSHDDGETALNSINLVELPLPLVDGLGPSHETTASLPPHLMPLLKKAFDSLETSFGMLLQRLSPDCVIHDFLQPWTSPVASKFGIPSLTFVPCSAVVVAYFLCAVKGKDSEQVTVEDLINPLDFPSSSTVRLHQFEALQTLNMYKRNRETGISDCERLQGCANKCSAIAVKTFPEIEGKFLRLLESLTGKHVVALGPLLTKQPSSNASEQDSKCLAWLDRQKRSSVVFVSFGTEYFLSKDQIEEIALGLEASEQSFMWVLRFPQGPEGNVNDQQRRVSASLSAGFEERMKVKGIVVSGWAPQMKILRHPSTGGFMTHCGWSSVMEGMSAGLPLIALPMQLDQPLNARLVAGDLKVAIEVRKGSDGRLDRNEIERALRIAMVEEEGLQLRMNAKHMGEIMMAKSEEERGLDLLVEEIETLVGKRNNVFRRDSNIISMEAA
uniref:Glycosyltransferase n=1 Tax=Ginkgo biloba TaxID=3311 RepID=G5DE80_GINBI|nr:putative UDP-glucose:flavonoid glucosyltransferase [Ginkgo biloba]|eukprot:Gb_40295 [translate_table: standard]